MNNRDAFILGVMTVRHTIWPSPSLCIKSDCIKIHLEDNNITEEEFNSLMDEAHDYAVKQTEKDFVASLER